MRDPTVYDELGVPTVINAAGTKTRISGSLMHDSAADAMRRASEAFVRLSDLQLRASELISEVTGAEAGYVTSGASAGCTLAAAACIAGTDLQVIADLPDTEGVADEIVMPRTHRNGYDHAFRVAGATIVDVGGNDKTLGTGGENTELWELDAAISEDTAAVAYMEKEYTTPDLADVVEVAHDNDVPVIVDAAAELPPIENLSAFVETGADLVIFSGGKGIRGPQTTGIVAGTQEYVESIAIQHLDMHTDEAVWSPPADLIDAESLAGVPRHGIGRGFKVGKEELVGLIYALQEFLETDHDRAVEEWRERAERIESNLSTHDGIDAWIEPGGKLNRAATVFAEFESDTVDAQAVALGLREENPRVFVGSDFLDANQITLNPIMLTDEQADYVTERVASYL